MTEQTGTPEQVKEKRDVDRIIELVKQEFPAVTVSQNRKGHQGDDPGMWFFTNPTNTTEIELETTTGNCPLMIQTSIHDELFAALNVDEVMKHIRDVFAAKRTP